MYRITTENGRVGHIAGSIHDREGGRIVTTLCGNTHPEYLFHVDDSLDACAACDKKMYNLVDEADDLVATVEESEKITKALVKVAKEESTTTTSTKK